MRSRHDTERSADIVLHHQRAVIGSVYHRKGLSERPRKRDIFLKIRKRLRNSVAFQLLGEIIDPVLRALDHTLWCMVQYHMYVPYHTIHGMVCIVWDRALYCMVCTSHLCIYCTYHTMHCTVDTQSQRG